MWPILIRQHNINRDQVAGGRIAVRIALTGTLETTVSAFYQHIESDGLDEVYLNPATLQPALGSLAYSAVLKSAPNDYELVGE